LQDADHQSRLWADGVQKEEVMIQELFAWARQLDFSVTTDEFSEESIKA